MIPTDKRGSYSALSNLSYTGADLIARSSIIIGAYMNPTMMSIYIGLIAMIGTSLVYFELFGKRYYIKKKNIKFQLKKVSLNKILRFSDVNLLKI